ncbi:MAG: GGDEF domain-containing response regulator [Cellvibrionaceae bacterium]
MTVHNKRRIRVLVIDDSSTIRIAATKVFDEDFDVLLAVDGEDGLDVIENDKDIQIVFTDLVMPEMDGFELLNALRTHKEGRINNLPIIVMTGAENPEIAKQKALSLGATDFITKPFNPTDIRARAHSYAKLSSTTKKLREKTTIDGLTGLLNPRGFYHQLDKEIAFATRHHYDMSAMSVEIDNYKDLFISMGRSGTERLIKRIGAILSTTFRKEDTVARVGLARFCISMPLVNRENAMEMANKICHNIENLKAILKGKRLKLTVSAGISHFIPQEGNHSKELIKATENALSKATNLGQSQIYLSEVAEKSTLNGKLLSIDSLIEQLNKGEEGLVADQLNEAIDHLAPLIALLSHEQKQKILTYR